MYTLLISKLKYYMTEALACLLPRQTLLVVGKKSPSVGQPVRLQSRTCADNSASTAWYNPRDAPMRGHNLRYP